MPQRPIIKKLQTDDNKRMQKEKKRFTQGLYDSEGESQNKSISP